MRGDTPAECGADRLNSENGQQRGALPKSERITVKTEPSVGDLAPCSGSMMREMAFWRKGTIGTALDLRQNLPNCHGLARKLANHPSSSPSPQSLKSIGTASGAKTPGNAASARLTSIFKSAS